MTAYYVDNVNGDDYDGASFVDGTYTDITKTVAKTGAFTNLVAGDIVYVDDNGSGNITTGYYTVATVPDANSITLTASAGVDATDVKMTQHTGLDNTSNEWRTISRAVRGITATGDIVYVQGGTDYTEAVAFTPAYTRLRLVGYTTTISDRGRAVIDGTGNTNCIVGTCNNSNSAWDIENFECKNATSDGLSITRSAGTCKTQLVNCYLHDNGGAGVKSNNSSNELTNVINCRIEDNAGRGIDGNFSSRMMVVNCRVVGNTGIGVYVTGSITSAHSAIINSVIADNSINVQNIALIVGSTLDGATGSDNWITLSQYSSTAVDSAFTNAAAFGIDPQSADWLSVINCGFYGNTSGDIDGTPGLEVGSVTGTDPGYTSAGTPNYDYTISAVAWKNTTTEVGRVGSGTVSYPDIGAIQADAPAGGSGGGFRAGLTGGMSA